MGVAAMSAIINRNTAKVTGFVGGGFSFNTFETIDEIGVFVQNGKVVGWSFGQWIPNGYMWQGKEGSEPEYNTWVRYFYDITFAYGREEKFAMALAMQKSRAWREQLAAFIDGFRLKPKLEEATPFQAAN